MSIDPKIKADWVKALRSGKYTQKFNNVGSELHLCCVGVGGIVAGLTPNVPKVGSSECAEALGLTHKQSEKLFELNDKDRWSFPQIADYIEGNL